MRHPKRRARVLSLTCLLASVFLPQRAVASPLEDPSMGGSTFTGVTAPHATSILINPAALAMSGAGLHVFAQMGTRISMLSVKRQTIDPTTFEVTDGESVSENIVMPQGMLALYGPVADRGSAAIAIGLPMIERFASSEEFRYHSGRGHFFQAQLSVAGHLRLGGRFHIGLGVSLAYSRLAMRISRDTVLDDGTPGLTSDCNGAPCGFENPAARQDLSFEASTQGLSGFFDIPDNIGAVIGALYEIRPDSWRIAASVVAPPGTFTNLPLRGDIAITDAPRDGGQTRRGTVLVPMRVPESIRVGVRGPITDDLEFLASVRWQNTSRHGSLDLFTFGEELESETVPPGSIPEWIPRFRGFRDSVRIQAGVERQLGSPVRYGGRLRLDTGAVKGSRLTPLQVEGVSVTASGGAEVRLAEQFVVTATYDLSWYPSRTTSPSAYDPRAQIECVDSMFEESSCGASLDGRGFATASGRYTRLEHGLVVSLRYDAL